MSTTTVRITERSAGLLRELAESSQMTMQDVVDRALETYRRQRMFDAADAAYAALWADREAAAAEIKERAEWDGVLADGLGDGAVHG